MTRAIVVPADLVPGALDELKQWLGISAPHDDPALVSLLRSSLNLCEAFTRQMPLQQLCEEVLRADTDWQTLATRPVSSITGLERMAGDGTRSAIAVEDYAIELDAGGTAHVRLTRTIEDLRLAVRFMAGVAPDWATLPGALRQGILRLAAHYYRQRDGDAARPEPPAAVAALWSPWRLVRLT